MTNKYIPRKYTALDRVMPISPVILLGGILTLAYFDNKEKAQPENQPKTLQIKSIEDRDNIKGYDIIISEDGRTFQIEERNGKLSILERSLEKLK